MTTVQQDGRSDVGRWLAANRRELGALARSTDVPDELIHLVAVLVLAGLTDGEIRDQLWRVEERFGTHQPLVAVELDEALREIRSLPALPGDGKHGGGSPASFM